MSDVLMYWQPTPVLGVFDTELPQFTILGFETNDRQVRTIVEKLYYSYFVRIFSHFSFFFIGTIGDGNVSAPIVVV